jgi:hypothetical protein
MHDCSVAHQFIKNDNGKRKNEMSDCDAFH